MHRQTERLTEREFDVLVIGGGAFGAAAARDAALRGLNTALIERADFGSGASAECFKMVHGGIRYMQHADIGRVRSSALERSTFLKIAPHLVSPLPIAIPTYGHGRKGKAFLGAGMKAYDLLTADRNASIADPTRRIRNTRFLSRAETLNLFPDLRPQKLTGAAIFEDGQMYNPARLVLAFVKSADAAGATVCNYVEATDFIWKGTRVRGARVRDRIGGSLFDVRAKLVLNAAGPWSERLLDSSSQLQPHKRNVFSRDAFVTLGRMPASKYALAIQGQSRDRDALFSRDARHLFLVPWRNFTLLGVWHRVFGEHPDNARVSRFEIQTWLDELNEIYPALQLEEQDICYSNFGLVPFGDQASGQTELSFGKESRIVDHREHDGVKGIVTVIGIRFTTAIGDSARALDLLLRQHPSPPPRAKIRTVPLAGGAIENFQQFRSEAIVTHATTVLPRTLDALLRNHGSDYGKVLERDPDRMCVPETDTLWAEVIHAIEEESAVRLEDIFLRRTDMGAGRHPGSQAIETVANHMAQLLGWSRDRRNNEIQLCESRLKAHAAVEGASRCQPKMKDTA